MSKTVNGSITINKAPAAVYSAFTESKQLTDWFSEFADVDLQQRRWEVWGRYTPDSIESNTDRIQITDVEPDSGFSFSWRVYNHDTSVAITLEPDGIGTVAVVSHSGLEDPASWLLEAYWSTSLENLRSWVEAGRKGLFMDFTEVGPGDVKISADINAPGEVVFSALTDPHQLERYMCEHASIELEIGGRYDIGWDDEGPLRIVDFVPDELLAYSWKVTDQDELTVVTWSLESSDNRTRLTMVHTGFAPDRQAVDYNAGWLDYVNRIKAMSETGAGWIRPQIQVNERAPAEV